MKLAIILIIALTGIATATEYRYEYVPFKTTYDNAAKAAQSKGGTLVKITDATANEKVRKLVGKYPVWIGADDRYEEGKWKWADGTPVTYHRWRQKPKRRRSANCAIMDTSGEWLDVVGHDKRPYVIQYAIKSKKKPETEGLSKYEIEILQYMSKMSLKSQKRFVQKVMKEK